MSEFFDRLNKILLSVTESDISQLLIDKDFDSDFAEALEFLYVDNGSKDTPSYVDATEAFEEGLWDREIKKYIGVIETYFAGAQHYKDVKKQQKEKERDEVDNWEKYEKELGTKREAPIDDVLGAYAFPASRSQKLPKEPDTDKEKKILSALDRHLNMSGEIPENLANDIVDILKSGSYSKVFKRCPPGTRIYRGMSVKESWIESAVGDNFIPSEHRGSYDGQLTFTPRSGKYSTSWSLRHQIAKNFSPERHNMDAYSVVMICDVTDDMYLLDCSKLYFAIPQFDQLSYEDEVICFGPVKCTSVEWERTGWFKLCQKHLIN